MEFPSFWEYRLMTMEFPIRDSEQTNF